ncbi:hypothetical protein Tco_1029103 [Tanacetum coccineum]|uniref:Uncharacterized protein n=1 Tax=Tanacetum coccineum TaxID=301880 RepID=A0ABQ5G4Q9_9ASTR
MDESYSLADLLGAQALIECHVQLGKAFTNHFPASTPTMHDTRTCGSINSKPMGMAKEAPLNWCISHSSPTLWFEILSQIPDPFNSRSQGTYLYQKAELSLKSVKLIQPILPLMKPTEEKLRNSASPSRVCIFGGRPTSCTVIIAKELDVGEKSRPRKSAKRFLGLARYHCVTKEGEEDCGSNEENELIPTLWFTDGECALTIAFNLNMNKSIVHTGPSALKYLLCKKGMPRRDWLSCFRWVLLLQDFDCKVIDTKEPRTSASRTSVQIGKNPYENVQ